MSIEQIFALLQTVGTWIAVAAALAAVHWQNRHSRHLLRVQLSVQLTAQYDSEAMLNSRSRLAARLLAQPGSRSIDEGVLVFFENVAFLARTDQVDPAIIWNLFALDIPYYWAASRTRIEGMRRDFGDPSLYEELEAMATKLSNAQLSPRGTSVPALDLTDVAVQRFLNLEADRGKPESHGGREKFGGRRRIGRFRNRL